MNMKKLILLFFISAAPLAVFSQATRTIDPETKLITYTEVVNMPGLTKDQLYKRAHKWFHKYYKNPAEVVKEKDSVAASIKGVHRFKITKDVKTGKNESVKNDAGLVQYDLSVMAKDGKYKYTVTRINWKQASYYPIEKWMDNKSSSYDPNFESYLGQTDQFVKGLIEELKKGMNESGEKKAADW